MIFNAADLFAGIGGIRLGFERAFGNNIQTVYSCEIDPMARKTYLANFSPPLIFDSDITKVDTGSVPNFDICLAGFPCQAFSLAGLHKGFNDARGNLFLDVVRFCRHVSPKVIFCENVKGLTSHDHGRTFKTIVNAFNELGYRVHHAVLNAKDFGLPQNRERIYIVCFRNDVDDSAFRFPSPVENQTCIGNVLETAPIPAKYYLSETYVEFLKRHKARHRAAGNGFGYIIRNLDSIAGALVCGGMGHEKNLIVDPRPHSTIPTTNIKGHINDENIRKLTPREWARLQGFNDSFLLPCADTHSYRQLGNTVAVNTVERIALQIRKVLINVESD